MSAWDWAGLALAVVLTAFVVFIYVQSWVVWGVVILGFGIYLIIKCRENGRSLS